MSAAADLTLTDARVPGTAGTVDIAISQGRIAAIDPAGPRPPEGVTLPLDGRLVLPAFCDGHIHLDKSFLGLPWRPHVRGNSIAARIAAERTERAALTEPLAIRARRMVERVIGFGTLALRSHVDVDEVIGLGHVETLLELRQDYRGRIDIQLVAFPQSGITPEVADLLDAALRLGVEVVGGLDPAGIDADIEGHLGTVFRLADTHGARIDIHLHDAGTLGTFELRQIAVRTRRFGLAGRVAVSHAFALGMVDADDLAHTAQALAEAGVAIMTNGPGSDAMPPVRKLVAAGVTVFGGCDNIRDAWSPFGSGDVLQRAAMIGQRADFRSDTDLELAFDLISRNSRTVLGYEPVCLAVGSPADLVALAAGSVAEAVATAPADRIVLRAGRLVPAAAAG